VQSLPKAREAATGEVFPIITEANESPTTTLLANGVDSFMNSPTPQDVSHVVALTASLLASGVMSRSHYDPELARTVVAHAIAIYTDINTQLGTNAEAGDAKAKT
jgi:hypothetical protein